MNQSRTSLPVVLLSHRGPVTFQRSESGWGAVRATGGLVNALTACLAEYLPEAVWVCNAMTDEDIAVARLHKGRLLNIALSPTPQVTEFGAGEASNGRNPRLNLRMVEVGKTEHRNFYSLVANPLLWFIQHGLYGLALEPEFTEREHDAFERCYVAVNSLFADAIAEEVGARGGHAFVMLHDYHFYLVGQLLRQRNPEVTLSHFVHIPWPGPESWRMLPLSWRSRIMTGLLGNDVVAFQTKSFARNFLLCAEELLGLPTDPNSMTVQLSTRAVRVLHYPISVDVPNLESLAVSPPVMQHVRTLSAKLLTEGRQLILRVDRTDPSKNIVRGFHAFARLLASYPDLVGHVTFLAILQPSRQDVPEYRDYLAMITAAAAEINSKYSLPGYQPIDLHVQNDFALAVAAYQVFDVLIANSLADGMNLVAKEAALLNSRNGVLALSETMGVHEELGQFAVSLHPLDIQQQADALYRALTMNPALRRAYSEAAAIVVRRNDIGKWLTDQLDDLAALAGPI